MVGADGSSHGGAVYCEVDGVASELGAENLRQEGLFVPTPEPLSVDREVELFLRSPAGTIVLRGLVVQVIGCADATVQRRSPGYGVLFLDLQDEQRAWITRTRLALEAQRPSPPPSPPTTAPSPMPNKPPARIDGAVERARAARSVSTSTLRTSTLRTSTLRTSTIAQLEGELAALKTRSPSEILGLASPQDVEAAHRAFLALSKRYHPHVYARFDDAEITRLATEIFIVYKRAYATLRCATKDGGAQRTGSDAPRPTSLSTPAARNATSSLPAPSSLRAPAPRVSMPPNGDPMARRIADAELLFASALRHVAASRFEQAELELAKAARLAPERIDIAIWRHVGKARAHRAGGRTEDATASYRKVLELDPQHREAREQVEPPAERRRGGLVSKWLGRGEE